MFYKHRVTQISLKTKDELRCSGRVSSSCSTSETRCVNLVTNPVISHEGERTEKCYEKWNISYPIELEIKDTTDTDRSASYLDIHFEIDRRVG
jgi:hypothetical protein